MGSPSSGGGELSARAIDYLLGVCAIGVLATVVTREFRSAAPELIDSSALSREKVADWDAVLDAARFSSPPNGRMRLIEFVDVECPFCRRAHKDLAVMQAEFHDRLVVGYIHFPLQRHRFALAGARAVECARDQGKLDAMLTVLFEAQDSLGLLTWAALAARANVEDLTSFESCLSQTGEVPGVAAGLALGARLRIPGTPAFVLEGHLLSRPPSLEEMRQLVLAVERRDDGR